MTLITDIINNNNISKPTSITNHKEVEAVIKNSGAGVDHIFPTATYYNPIIDNHQEVQNELKSVIDGIDFKYRDGWGETHLLSDIDFQGDAIEKYNLRLLHQEIHNNLCKYCKTERLVYNKHYFIDSSWFSAFKKGNYAHVHNHGLSDVSGVYYYKTTGSDGDFFLCSPNPYSKDRLAIEPVEGKLLMFPGWLEHGVMTNTTDNLRISFSFNIFFDKKLIGNGNPVVFTNAK